MQKIVLTGGPCAGKTTILAAVADHFGNQVGFVPEVATMLLSSGWPMPGRDIDWTPEWRDAFQRAVAATQIELETAYTLRAQQHGQLILVTDRGLMDGAAYHATTDEFLESTGLDSGAALLRYDAVIHLESLAVAQASLYSQGNNVNRFESLEEAVQRETATRRAWSGHARHLIVGGADLEHKLRTTIEIIEQALQ